MGNQFDFVSFSEVVGSHANGSGASESLVLCDDQVSLDTLREALTCAGFKIQICRGQRLARHLLETCKFDLILQDRNRASAANFLADVKRSVLNHFAICIAVVERECDVRSALRCGADMVLAKPISVDLATRVFQAVKGCPATNFVRTGPLGLRAS